MALRSIGIQFKGLPNKNLCHLRPSLCLRPAATTWHNGGDKNSMPIQQIKKHQIDSCEPFYKNLNITCFKRCAVNENGATVYCRGQNDRNSLMIKPKIVSSEKKLPNLDVQTPIRKVAPVSKDIKDAAYISPEFKELLRKHDAEMQQKYILSFLPDKYTRNIRKTKVKVEMKPYCICEDIKQATATAGGNMKLSKKRNFFKRLSCCTRRAENFKECQCARGKEGKCEICSQNLAKKSILKKNGKKRNEKQTKLSKEKSVEIIKGSKGGYWVGTENGDLQEKVAKRERFKQAFEKQNKLQQRTKKDKKKVKPKKSDKKKS